LAVSPVKAIVLAEKCGSGGLAAGTKPLPWALYELRWEFSYTCESFWELSERNFYFQKFIKILLQKLIP
jgi:hypothetical protein